MKVMAAFLSVIIMMTVFFGAAPIGVGASGSLIGDIDEDGLITVSDALEVLRVSVGLSEYSEDKKDVYDVWSDGEVGVEDALGVLRSAIGIIGSFGRVGVEFVFEPNAKAIESGVTQEMLDRAVLSTEGTARLSILMEKAANGEDISIVTLGGSITAGSSAGAAENRYTNIISAWWKNNFPEANVTLQNSGIGATGSLLGVHRLERDVLAYNPDLLVIEYAVNDCNSEKVGTAESFENLIRRVMTESPDTAIIVLFMVSKYNDSQYYQQPIAEAYGLPMISYRDALLPEIEAGRMTWEGIAPDEIHPNTQGHGIAGSLVTSYLDGIKRVYKDSTRVIPAIPLEAIHGERFMNAKLNWAGGDLEPISLGSWKLDSYGYANYSGSWYYRSGREAMVFETECKSIMLFYEEVTAEGASGSVKIYIDGVGPIYLRSLNEYTWGNSLTISDIYYGEKTEKHTIKIIPGSGKFRIAAILTA